MAATAVKALVLIALSSSLALGGVINVSSNSALNAANNDAGPGDTVKVATGTYTIQINPTNAGTSGSPIVYMPATAGSVCSLYVATPSINLTTDYVIVQGFRVKASNASNEMTVQSGDHTAIMDCRLYAFPSATASWDTWQITGDYCRFIGNVCNGLETSRDADGERHEGIVVGGLAKYFIVEGNTVSRITHYGITVQGGGSAPGPSWGVVRNNVAFDCHVNLGQNYYNKNNLYEGNRTYSGGQMLSYRPGISYEGSANQSILRYNMFYGDSVDQNATGGRKSQMSEILTQSAGTIDYDNRLYGNALVGLSRNVAHQSVVLVQNDAEGNAMGKSVWVNNIIAYPNTTRGGFCYVYQDNSVGATKDTLRNNLFWAAAAGDTVTDIDYTRRTLAATEAAYPTLWSGNIEAVPLWTDSLSLRGSRNFALSASSPCVDAGAALTTVASNVSSSTLVTVGDARYFHYDWGMSPYDRGDSVLIGTNRCELDSVDYTNRRLILKSAITVTAGAGVHVLATYRTATASYTTRLSGSAPDIGPYERTSTGGTSLPGSTTLVSPDSGSTAMQPITFRWRAVAGATKYWFSLSTDNWGSLAYDNSALTDTLVTVSGLTVGSIGVWNVATGNSVGWNTSAWSSWWTVEIADNAPTADTLTVDWNKTIVPGTLTASTAIEFSNLQRRDLLLVLYNATGNTVRWPANVKWVGMAEAPQPAIGDTTVYWFVRDGAKVYGFDMSAAAASNSVTAAWVQREIYERGSAYLAGESEPLLSGVNTSPLGRVGTLSGADGTTLWYGHVVAAPDGTLVYGYCYGGSQIRFRTSTDDGRTWSAFSIAASAPAGHTYEQCSFGITPSGTWVFLAREDSSQEWYTGGDLVTKCLKINSIRSTDNGATWTLTDTIATTASAGTTGGVESLSDGTLISAYSEGCFGYLTLDSLYHRPAGYDTTKIKIVRSTDDGVTWGIPQVIDAHHDSVYQLNRPWLDEPAIAVDANDHVVVICRNPDYGTSQLVSADGGVTWTFSGVIGQTNCGPGVYSNNSSPDIMRLNDSTFMMIVGYRLNPDGPGTDAGKKGYLHILTGTWNEIQDATFGWSTFIPPTPVTYGDAGAHRIVMADDTTLVMVQMQGGRTHRLTPAEVTKARGNWVLSMKESMQFRPMHSYSFSDSYILSNTDYATLYHMTIPTAPQYDSITTMAIGMIPVVSVAARFDDAGGADTAWIKLADTNGLTMQSNGDSLVYVYYDALTGPSGGRSAWHMPYRTWFPTKLRNASGTVVLGQFEKPAAPVEVQVKSSSNSRLKSIKIDFGYIAK